MARTPSLTTTEAEALLGRRGDVRATSDNRATLKKWLSAQGFPAAFTAGLSLAELGIAYNETDGSGLAKLRVKYDRAVQDGDFDREPAQDAASPQNEPVAFPARPMAHGNPVQPNQANDPAALLRELILGGWQPSLDENAVRAIVQESIAGIAPRSIEVRHPDKDAIRVEGLVHPEFERVLGYLTQGLNVMLVGPAGCGKTYLVAQLAKALDVQHTIIACTAGTTEGDIVGRLLPVDGGNFRYIPSEFVNLYEGGNALLAFDEMDKLDPNMAAVANMPLANGHAYVHLRHENPRVKRGENVYFIATANTYGTGADPLFVGSGAQDEATRDRFVYVSIDYDKRLEESIAAAGGLSDAETAAIWELRDRCREARLPRTISTRAFQKAAAMKRCGDSWREIRDRLLAGWSKDEKAKVGA